MSSISKDILNELAEKNFIVFAGTGVDSSANIPNWEKLLEHLVKIAHNMGFNETVNIRRENQEEFPTIAQKVYTYLDSIGKKEVYFEKIKEVITPQDIPYGTEHFEIVKTTNWIITTNFSNMFEEAFKSKLETQESEENVYFESLPEFSMTSHFEKPTVVYLHGKADENFIIFKEDDYKKYYPSISSNDTGAKDVEDYLKYIYKNYTLVFIGFGFEIYIRETFRKIYKDIERSDKIASEKPGYIPKLDKIKHYCFLKLANKDKKQEEEQQQKLISTLKNINIEVIKMEQYRDWIECFKKIREIRKKSRPVEVGNGI